MTDRSPPRATDQNGLLLGDLEAGARVGDYVIEGRLPTRGTGHLYAAMHRLLPRRAVIKVLPSARTGSALAFELLREACILEALDHPGIPRIFETGMLEERRPWIASELIEGATAAGKLAIGTTSVAEVTAIVRDVAAILDYAHGRGVFHLHVVPSAIVFPEPARRFPLSLIDWSAARTHDAQSPLPMILPASRPYLAPEQLAGGSADGRADVHALGAVARELLRGARLGTTPPILQSLLQSMTASDPALRPTAAHVLDAATWLAAQIDEESIPDQLDLDATQPVPIPPIAIPPMPRASRPITSDGVSAASGEIDG